MTAPSDAPIGVFDSGVGGLTVLRALRERMPHESFVYLGDTARLPYGTKSPETVRAYALQAAAHLAAEGIKLLVVACNTASAVAVEALAARFAPVPVVGVVEPGAAAAAAGTRNGRILITGTDGTISGGAYDRAIHARLATAELQSRACPLFVALAEEGWTDGPIVEAVVRRYLGLLLEGPARPDTVVLGCTHFPVLRDAIARVCGDGVTLVDSATTTADAVQEALGPTRGSGRGGRLRYLATDAPDRFARVGSLFLGAEIAASDVDLVDL